jgi:hypothetical protein
LTMPFGTTIDPSFSSKIPLLMSMRNVDGESRGSLAFSSLSLDTEGS